MAKKIKVKPILEMRYAGSSYNDIVVSKRVSKHTAIAVCNAAAKLSLDTVRANNLSEEELYEMLFPDKVAADAVFEPVDYEYVHSELKRTGVTLKLLHDEYSDECRRKGKVSVSYTKYCRGYSQFTGSRNIASHLEHKPGDRIEVDWSGPTMHYLEPSGKKITVYLFVADLVYSRLAYVEPCLHMDMTNWLRCNINMWQYYGGVSRILVCDNLKTGIVEHPKHGEIILTKDYESLSEHYNTAILPADVKSPRQKNSTEGTVGDIATSIIAKLRNIEFHSFNALCVAVAQKLEEHNNAPFQKRDGSRRSAFEAEEKQYLKPLPSIPYDFGIWVYGRKVQLNCHVAFEKNFYSCPHEHVGKIVDLRVTPSVISIYLNDTRIKTHARFAPGIKNKYRTDAADMPKDSQFSEWTEERIMAWATRIGSATATTVQRILESRPVVEQAFNSALAVLRMSSQYNSTRLEKACEMALQSVPSPRYHHLRAILSSGQDISYQAEKQKAAVNVRGCLRGSDYYKNLEEVK